MTVLVTGGAGYIGSHICVELLNNKKDILVLDSFINSNEKTIEVIKALTGKNFKTVKNDMQSLDTLVTLLFENDITEVIHTAGLKDVSQSIRVPLDYYRNNFLSTLNLIEAMSICSVNKIIFSSSAAVYGDNDQVPLNETEIPRPSNPYAKSKLYAENLIKDACTANKDLSAISLRYFNPLGADKSGRIGESSSKATNIMPYIIRAASTELDKLRIYGGNYNTMDGTAVRDYIHITDLAKAHLSALEALGRITGFETINICRGIGTTVLELVNAFERVNQIDVLYEIVGKRDGDIPISYGNAIKAKKLLEWEAKLTLEEMCESSWNEYNYNRRKL